MIKKLIAITAIFTMVYSVSVVSAYGNEAALSSKVETVYGILDNKGEPREIYVVNEFEIEKAGLLIDYGNYHRVTNLTNGGDINIEEDKVQINTDRGLFYYKGDSDIKELPWDFEIEYRLDGKEISPDVLAGAQGELNIKITGVKNQAFNEDYNEKYLLQVTVTLDSEKADDIITETGILTSVGGYKVITFAGIPGEDLDCEFTCAVKDFEMQGITINAVPLSIDKDMLEMEEFEQGLLDLTSGVAELNEGAESLTEGSGEIAEGINELSQGSNDYYRGLLAIESAGKSLENGSSQILLGLNSINAQLGGINNDDLINGLNEMKTGLIALSGSLDYVRTGLIQSNDSLAEVIEEIPSETLTVAERQDLEAMGDPNIFLLLDYYDAGLKVKQKYAELSPEYQVMFQSLDDISTGITEVADNIDLMIAGLNDNGFSQLVIGLNQIAVEYAAFDAGLKDYLDGISNATSGYETLDTGINRFNVEYGDFHDGVTGLSEGIGELKEGTDTIPNEIEALIKKFDNSDYSPVSYASEKNGEIDALQFLITTTGIEKEEEPKASEENEKNLTFWDRLINLFIRD